MSGQKVLASDVNGQIAFVSCCVWAQLARERRTLLVNHGLMHHDMLFVITTVGADVTFESNFLIMNLLNVCLQTRFAREGLVTLIAFQSWLVGASMNYIHVLVQTLL